MAEYAALADGVWRSGAKIFFADEAHFRADAELRGKWVLKGEPALVDSSSQRYGEKASYYSAVCLETGEVEWMELEGNSNAETSAAFLRQLRERHTGALNVIWDNAPAHRGEAVREFLQTPGLDLQLVNLPGYSPDFNGDEAIGAGRGKRQRETCAWGPRHRCRKWSATSSPAWPAGKKKSDGAAGPSSNPGPKVSSATHSLIPNAP